MIRQEYRSGNQFSIKIPLHQYMDSRYQDEMAVNPFFIIVIHILVWLHFTWNVVWEYFGETYIYRFIEKLDYVGTMLSWIGMQFSQRWKIMMNSISGISVDLFYIFTTVILCFFHVMISFQLLQYHSCFSSILVTFCTAHNSKALILSTAIFCSIRLWKVVGMAQSLIH